MAFVTQGGAQVAPWFSHRTQQPRVAKHAQFVCEVHEIFVSRRAVSAPAAGGALRMAASKRGNGAGGEASTRSSSSARRGGGSGSTRGSGMRGVDTSMERRRPNRVAEMIKREISMVLRDQYTTHARFHGLPSWSTLMLSVMDVNVSPDLRNARIEVSMAQADMSRVLKWLNGNRRTLRYEMAQRMTHMKIMPDLYFKESGAGGAFRTVSILDELAKKRELVAATTNFDELEADSDDEDASDEEFDLDSGTNEDFDLDASASNKLK